ncbi:hypothetical protein NLG97_g9787 [Lecanicillium saksenae]|uniref:Uncharacterized protein n=1 Tax=Lecanicillium saksenae TaxID=468837 RepID=A0ACC1QF73_9HYPO|nr:hypothetical protein NLG97_g9787 [Lecanicillium saksenae]
MSSTLAQPSFLKALYVGNALWFTSAFYHFTFRQDLMMRKLSLRKTSRDAAIAGLPSGDLWHHDIMAYLGGTEYGHGRPRRLPRLQPRQACRFGLHGRVLHPAPPTGTFRQTSWCCMVLGLGNFSQAVLNFTKGRGANRWIMGKGLDRITVLDAAFTVLDWAAAFGGR